mmetsp:Transcript_10807/g.31459  ORF Transcript_10807/g.31459 Transcript_10807/m.31459 type:complete len:111 (+) Transcript_10807:593-925(+)
MGKDCACFPRAILLWTNRFIDTDTGDNQAEEVATRAPNAVHMRFIVVDCVDRRKVEYVVDEKVGLRVVFLLVIGRFLIEDVNALVAIVIQRCPPKSTRTPNMFLSRIIIF